MTAVVQNSGLSIDGRGPGSAVDSLVRAAVGLDVEYLRDTVAAEIAEHGVVAAWERLIHPAWAALHHPYDEMILTERLFTRTVSLTLAAAGRPSGRPPATVVLVCAENEEHALPLDAIAAAVAENGVGACSFGSQIPRNALVDAVGQLRPAVVVIWSQSAATADPSQVTELLAAHPTCDVIPAGPGWTAATLPVRAAPLTRVFATVTVTSALLQRRAAAVAA